MLLAIDSSTGAASVALYDERGVIGETTWRTRENHTRSLMPEIVRLLDLCRVRVHDLKAFGVATGPGSFTGLRIGLSAAKGLALSQNASLVGIPTLDICAHAFAGQSLPVWAILEAGRGRFAAALYESRGYWMDRRTDYVFGAPATIAARLETLLGELTVGAEAQTEARSEVIFRVLVTGELSDALIELLCQQFGERVVIMNPGARSRRAGLLADLAWRRWKENQVDDLNTLAPFYIPTASLGS